MCEWDDFSYFLVSILLEAFDQVSTQENISFGRRCWLRNSKMSVNAWPSLMCEWDDFCYFCVYIVL